MTIIDAIPLKTNKLVKDLIPGDVIIHTFNGQPVSDMVVSVTQMPIDFGLDYGNLFVQVKTRRAQLVLGKYHVDSRCHTFTVRPSGSYNVLTEALTG